MALPSSTRAALVLKSTWANQTKILVMKSADLGYTCCQDFGSSVLGFGQEIKLPRHPPRLPSYPYDLHLPIHPLPASWGLTSGSHSPSTIHLTTSISADGQSKLKPAPKIITESLTAVYPPITRDYGSEISVGGQSQLEGQD
ncbi:hypothetical protein BDQ12DRAFT_738446 [Crucibulum laeve]|uniref:Uncharacterized protein n=1 Tax=Crucibulum laeve TaxID=68775 RepID=A0A5C3LN92_9AGAR|nr:hypothetical protein BDQ12DRAFT_738446 [Crucibulum laeve]